MEDEIGERAKDVVEFAEEFEVVTAEFFLEFVKAETGIFGVEITNSAKFIVGGDSLFFGVFDVFDEGEIVGATFGENVVVAAIEIPGFVAVEHNHVGAENDFVAIVLAGFPVTLEILFDASEAFFEVTEFRSGFFVGSGTGDRSF